MLTKAFLLTPENIVTSSLFVVSLHCFLWDGFIFEPNFFKEADG